MNDKTQPPQGVMADLRELLARATSGEWSLHRQASTAVLGGTGYVVATCGGHSDNRRDPTELHDELEANAALIVAMHRALPGLLDEVEEVHVDNKFLREAYAKAEAENAALLARCEGLEAALVRMIAPFAHTPDSQATAALLDARAALAATRTTGDR